MLNDLMTSIIAVNFAEATTHSQVTVCNLRTRGNTYNIM